MRVVVACVPQTGHVVPLLPLARALVAQGDDVVVATAADIASQFEAHGLTVRPCGPGFGDWYERLRARTRGVPGDGLPPARVEGYFLPRLFGEIGVALVVDDLLTTTRDHGADLLLHDPLLYAAPVVGEVLGIPTAVHSIGPSFERSVIDLVADAVSPVWREFGLEPLPAAGTQRGATIAVCPPSLEPAGDVTDVIPMRPTALPVTGAVRPEEIPSYIWDAPVVYVTLGTFSNNNVALFRLVIDALASLPVSVVVTVGRDVDPAALEPVPANTYVTSFVPQENLLPHCTAVVHHAGAGTMFGVLAHGLPSLALPQSADNFRIAERLDAAQAAAVLMPGDVSNDAVTAATERVLTDGRLRTGAGTVAHEIAEMPAPDDVAAELRRRCAVR